MARGEPPQGSELPAPYRSPWRALAESLRAVAADRRLALRRLWRRNLAGELPFPGVWPERLAPLFWPLVLTAVLVLALGTVTIARRSGATPPPELATDSQAPAGRNVTDPGAQRADEPGIPPAPGAAADGTRQPTTSAMQRLTPGAPEAAAADSPGDQNLSAEPLQLDPLLELLTQAEDADLLLAAQPDPATGLLRLTLSQAGGSLPEASLLSRARLWQQRAAEAGYERLELRDRQGRLRGRQALVGSGMILLAPLPGS